MRGSSAPPTQPLAFYSGIVTVKPDGTAGVFDILDFAGTARDGGCWSKDKVKAPATSPTYGSGGAHRRFLLNGDQGTMHPDLDNVEGPAGDYRLEVKSEGVAGNPRRRGSSSTPSSAAPSPCR
jgi:uncharacterized protein YfaS (alpha-2-macroglobulin family)